MRRRAFTLVAAVAVAAVSGCEPQTPEGKAQLARSIQENDDEVDVSMLAEKAVKQYLKWPLDASFGWSPSISFNQDRSAASVEGTVKAKNDFGAALTHQYGVILKRDAAGWVVDMVPIGSETVYRRSPESSAHQTTPKAGVEKRRSTPLPPPEPVVRTWTDASGDHKVEAEFHGVINGVVTLKKKDGKIIKLPLEKLSEEDRKWIKDRGKLPQ